MGISDPLASRLTAMPILPSWRLSELIREARRNWDQASDASERFSAQMHEVVREREPYGAPEEKPTSKPKSLSR